MDMHSANGRWEYRQAGAESIVLVQSVRGGGTKQHCRSASPSAVDAAAGRTGGGPLNLNGNVDENNFRAISPAVICSRIAVLGGGKAVRHI